MLGTAVDVGNADCAWDLGSILTVNEQLECNFGVANWDWNVSE